MFEKYKEKKPLKNPKKKKNGTRQMSFDSENSLSSQQDIAPI